MSTITITFETQFVDFPETKGRLTIRFNNGTQVLNLYHDLVDAIPVYRQFQESKWIDGVSNEDELQASYFALAFTRDYKTIGSELLPPGANPKNLVASASGNVVTITATQGTFENDSSYTGNTLTVTFGTPSNNPIVDNPLLGITNLGAGNCTTINHSVTATGGTGPYTLVRNGVDILSWDGSASSIALVRGATYSMLVRDNLGNESNAQSVFVPRQLNAQEFSVSLFQYEASADVTVNNDNPINLTSPLQYSIDAVGSGSGGNYQSSNVFSGVLEGTYELYIQDQYGCEVGRTIQVTGSGTQDGTVLRTFIISPMNSLSFARRDDLRRGYENTLSWEEPTRIKKQELMRFTSDQPIQTQFKSSYPYHEIRVSKCDGTSFTVTPVLIQENIGVTEKVDCETFPVSATEIGVYFDGGNSYTKDTTDVIGASPYTTQLPPWAEVGNYARFDSIGQKQIQSIGYDEDIDRLYFVVSGTIASAVSDLVQATFNRHDYNVYRADFNMSEVDNLAYATIQAGFEASTIEETWRSETLQLLTNTKDWLKIEWEADRIVEDMLFIDGIKGYMWLKGRLRPIGETSTDNYSGTEEVYPIDADASLGMAISVPVISAKLWHKFILISGLSKVGRVYIEDQLLIRKSEVEISPIGVTNLYSLNGDFFFEDEGLTVRGDEIVLDVDTGLPVLPDPDPGNPVPPYQGYERLKLADGTYLKLSTGFFVSL